MTPSNPKSISEPETDLHGFYEMAYGFEISTEGIRMKLAVMSITYDHEPFIAQTLECFLAHRVNSELNSSMVT
jgi:hypothetical protein